MLILHCPRTSLLIMLTDNRYKVRELAVQRISACMQSESIEIHKCPVLPFNLDSTNYVDLIHWNSCQIISPPALDYVDMKSLQEMLRECCKKAFLKLRDIPKTLGLWDISLPYSGSGAHGQNCDKNLK